MGGRAAPDGSHAEKGHKKPLRQKKVKHRGYSKSKRRRRHDSQSPSSSSSPLSSFSSSSPSSSSSDSESGSDDRRVRARNKGARSRHRREKLGGSKKRDRGGRKKDRLSPSRRVKPVSKKRKSDSSSKTRLENERGRQRKRARRDREEHVSASRSPSSGRSCSSSDSRPSSRSRSSSRHRNNKIERTKHRSRSAGKQENTVEIIQEFGDFPSSHSYNSDNDFKNPEKRDAKYLFPTSLKNASPDLVTDSAGRQQLEHSSEDGDHSRYRSQDTEDSVTKLKSMVVAPAKASEDSDLELILRQRALENLKKFRRENASNIGSSVGVEDGQVQNKPHSSSVGVEDVQVQNRPHSLSSRIVEVGVKNRSISMSEKLTQYTGQGLASSIRKGVPTVAQKKHASLKRDSNNGIPPPGPIEKSVANQSVQISDKPGIIGTSGKLQYTNTSNLSASTLSGVVKHFPSGSASVGKEGRESSDQLCLEPESSSQCLLEQKKFVNKTSGQGSEHETVSHAKKADATKVAGPDSMASSAPGQVPDDSKKSNVKSEASAEDQLEKKTMTVMRGGEMVQVSYKVYIPKKTPALARRQLQR